LLRRLAAKNNAKNRAARIQEGDSAQFASAREGFQLLPPHEHPYFKVTDGANPLAFPIKSPNVMAQFPPSLLIASTAISV